MNNEKFQRLVLEALALQMSSCSDDEVDRQKRIFKEIRESLNPKEPDPTIPEQTDKSMNRVIKAGQDCPRCGVKEVPAEKVEYHNSGRCIPKIRSKFGKREK